MKQVFYYKAKQGPAQIIEGMIEADNVDMAISRLLQTGYTPLDVKVTSDKKIQKKIKNVISPSPLAQKVRVQDVMIFTRQLSDLVNAGVPVLRALQLVHKQIKNKHFKQMTQQMISVIQAGGPLSTALTQFPALFSPLYVNIIRSGEVGGNLNIVLDRVADFVEKDYDVRAQVRTSLFYPAFLLLAGGVTIFVILTWVIPRISTIFIDMNESLPLVTMMLLAVSRFLARFWWLLIGAGVLTGVYLKHLYSTTEGKIKIDGLKLKLPVIGQFIKDVEIGRFARTLGTLLGNGVTVVTAIDTVQHVIDNELLKQDIAKMTQQVTEGASLTQSMQASSLFPEAAANMVAIGEETGQLHVGLTKLAVFYEHQSERAMKRITSLIEPVLILVLGLFIGFIVLGMLLPIFRMNLIIR